MKQHRKVNKDARLERLPVERKITNEITNGLECNLEFP